MRSWQDLLPRLKLLQARDKLRAGLADLRQNPSPRKLVPPLLMLVGVILLLYVASQYWGMHRSQQELAREWERQAATANVAGHAVLSPQDMLTRVIIKKIGLDAIVVEGAS